jgi:mRNA-degrading endonuclease toxin of MazEF toxin-antitoxin module
MGMVSRGEVYLVNLNPTVGSEVKKTRPCLIISPDEMNQLITKLGTLSIKELKTVLSVIQEMFAY